MTFSRHEQLDDTFAASEMRTILVNKISSGAGVIKLVTAVTNDDELVCNELLLKLNKPLNGWYVNE